MSPKDVYDATSPPRGPPPEPSPSPPPPPAPPTGPNWYCTPTPSTPLHQAPPPATPPVTPTCTNPASLDEAEASQSSTNKPSRPPPSPPCPSTHLKIYPSNSLAPPLWSLSLSTAPPKPHPSFLSDFSDFVTHLNTISSSVLLLGDFNFHIDNPTCKQASDFLDLLDTLNLTQHVQSPTHSHGHTLDLVCSTGISIHHLSTTTLYISDHLSLSTSTPPPPPPPHSEKRQISFRNLKSISPQDLSASLSATLTASPPSPSAKLPDLLNYYNDTLSSCLDQLAPLKTKTVSFRHSAPWFTSELHKMKSHKRQLEHLYRKTGLTVHLQAYTDHLHLYRTALNSARSSFYSNLIHSGSSNQKALFSTVKKLLHPIDSTSITFTPEKCNTFLSSFQSKINAIHNSLPPPSIPRSSPPPPPSHQHSPASHLFPQPT
ncbi:hypothetical protein D5F01_LYC22364 [Xyrichtys novacula]|uniref:Endonuclease/exonuclease/phosphatase domain-containing protein n=1 Tax=Xyrichtys novacula TaxID=13765 RepID=A0AAV1FEQ8_XYRNO|nr:hypothetical protein D5F01_LYC22364 [Xyrichtys novacula]